MHRTNFVIMLNSKHTITMAIKSMAMTFKNLSSSNFFKCKIYYCQRLYSSIHSFEKHLARWHPDCNFESFSDFTYSLSIKPEASSINETENEDISDSCLSFDRIKLSNENSFAKNMMHFCLKLQENIFYLIPPTLAS